jgi:hypothetical protein
MGSTISLVADLGHAADQVPILWREIEHVFVIQERSEVWRRRMRAASAGQQPDLGRQHAWAIMAWHWDGPGSDAGHGPSWRH